MNARFQDWWLARGAVARKLVKLVLSLVVIIGAMLFLSFNMHGEGSKEEGLKTRITIGQPGPWIVYEKIDAMGVATNGSMSGMSTESYVNILSPSFVAGALAIYSLNLLSRIGRIEKKERQENPR